MKSATDSDNLQRLYRDINPRFTERSTARLQNADEPSIAARLRLPSRETAFPSSQSRLSNRSAQYEWLWACPLHPAHLCKGPKTGFIQPPSIDQPVCSPADRQTRLLSARDTAIADSSVAAMSATQVVCFVMTGRDGTLPLPSPPCPSPPNRSSFSRPCEFRSCPKERGTRQQCKKDTALGSTHTPGTDLGSTGVLFQT